MIPIFLGVFRSVLRTTYCYCFKRMNTRVHSWCVSGSVYQGYAACICFADRIANRSTTVTVVVHDTYRKRATGRQQAGVCRKTNKFGSRCAEVGVELTHSRIRNLAWNSCLLVSRYRTQHGIPGTMVCVKNFSFRFFVLKKLRLRICAKLRDST